MDQSQPVETTDKIHNMVKAMDNNGTRVEVEEVEHTMEHLETTGKKKNKKEPEFSHFCDTCDRAFKNTEKYNEHMSQHVKCSVSDCNFMAHEKIVNIHWKNNHAPGAKRIKLDTLEEIAKWREERRKNYPTRDNVEKKKKLMEIREETGGVLETAQFGQMRGRGRGRGRGWGNRGFRGCYQRGGGGGGGGSRHFSDFAAKSQTLTKLSRAGDPLGALAGGDHDSDKEDTAPESKTVAPKQMSSALGSLMANYGSMSESEEEPESTPIQKANELIQENRAILNTMPAKSQESGPISTNTESHGHPYSRGRRRGRGGRGGRGRHWETPQQRRPTLLEMLLAPDVRHERNILLQCVRYIVKNNFFGLEDIPHEKNKEAVDVTNGKHTNEDEDKLKCSFGNGCKVKEKATENGGDNSREQVKTTDQCVLQDCTTFMQDSIQFLTSDLDCSEQSSGLPVATVQSSTIVMAVPQNTGCGQVITTDRCMLQECTTLMQNATQVLTSSPRVGNVDNCAVQSSTGGVEAFQNTYENKSIYHICDDEIWESHL